MLKKAGKNYGNYGKKLNAMHSLHTFFYCKGLQILLTFIVEERLFVGECTLMKPI